MKSFFNWVVCFFAGYGVVGFYLDYFAEKKPQLTCEPQTIVEQVKVPVGQDELLNDLIACRKELLELNEAQNGKINCRDQNCE